MAAAAFLALLVFAQGSPSSPNRITYNCTVSDVNAAFYIFPDGNSFVQLPSDGAYYLVDVQLSAAGTDTRTANIYANQRITPNTIQNASNLATNLARQFLSAPVGFKPGAMLRFTQVT